MPHLDVDSGSIQIAARCYGAVYCETVGYIATIPILKASGGGTYNH
ncbi:hypothetical protein ACFL5Z_11310 [Planctomycetota bacterium]